MTPEQRRVLELTYKNFVRAGAKLNDADKARLKAILERLAGLSTQFSQNVLADESSWLLLLDESDLDGLSPDFRAGAARIAAERGSPGKYGVTLSRSSVEVFLQSSTRRDLRETVFRAWASRGENAAARPTTARSSAKSCSCAKSARSCSASTVSPLSNSTTPWRRRRPPCAN